MLPSVCALLVLTLMLFLAVLVAWRRLGPRTGPLLNSSHASSPPSAALAHRLSGLCAALDEQHREALQHCETTLAREQQLLAQSGCYLPPHSAFNNNYAVAPYLDRSQAMICKEMNLTNDESAHLSVSSHPPPPHSSLDCNTLAMTSVGECGASTGDHCLPSAYATNSMVEYALPKPPTLDQLCATLAPPSSHLLHRWNNGACTAQLKPPIEFASNNAAHDHSTLSSTLGTHSNPTAEPHTYDVPIPPKWV
jgi:hypothetical protein